MASTFLNINDIQIVACELQGLESGGRGGKAFPPCGALFQILVSLVKEICYLREDTV